VHPSVDTPNPTTLSIVKSPFSGPPRSDALRQHSSNVGTNEFPDQQLLFILESFPRRLPFLEPVSRYQPVSILTLISQPGFSVAFAIESVGRRMTHQIRADVPGLKIARWKFANIPETAHPIPFP